MGSIMIIVCVMVAMAGLASRVQANYHVSTSVLTGGSRGFIACPSNFYNCACYAWPWARSGTISQRPPSLTNFFTITNFCGYQKLDHYHNYDGSYSVFVAGGDGKVVAKCYGADTGKVTIGCTFAKGLPDTHPVYDHLICYGNPCQPDSQHGSHHHSSID